MCSTVETVDAEEVQAPQGETSYSGTLVSSKSINPFPKHELDAAAAEKQGRWKRGGENVS